MYLVISAVSFVLVIGALIDIITRQDTQVKHLPKIVWVMLVVFLPLIGSILWFVLGREYTTEHSDRSMARPRARGRQHQPQHDQFATTSTSIRSTEEQLADLEREIEFHDKQARVERLQRELEQRREGA
ncbi:PLD nuclease N-terminal domain-containing protein [Mycetocola zhadangensis]|uniref:PLDc_N domain-containing protein n=1 Tax=Mycetocola zhadangensis TaxID=1164595 RepID=A0A3L7J6X7_9MICO|nr:PLD nuclease N-terminal domain-containing protein [Mycetocola zhadangensis]RLQ86488.1 PLDc_N domain-containing protein [Mycetocola zhadangensis]